MGSTFSAALFECETLTVMPKHSCDPQVFIKLRPLGRSWQEIEGPRSIPYNKVEQLHVLGTIYCWPWSQYGLDFDVYRKFWYCELTKELRVTEAIVKK